MSTDRPAAQREQMLLLCCLIGTAQMTWGAIVPAMPLYLESRDASLTSLGLVLAGFAIGRAVANTPAGAFLRWWRPRPYLWMASLGLAITTMATGLCSTLVALVVVRVIAGVFGGIVVTVAFAVLVTAAPADRRGTVVATATVVMLSSAAVGAVLGGVVIETLGVRWTFVAAAVPLLVCLSWEGRRPAAAYWAPYARSLASDEGGRSDSEAPITNHHALLFALCGVSFATFLVRFAGEQGLVPVMAYDGAGMSPLALAAAMAIGTLVSLAATPLFGRLVDAGRRAPLLYVGGAAGAVAIMSLPLLDTPVAFGLGLVAYFAATSAVNVVPGVVVGETWGPRQSGAVVGITRTVGDIGAAIGPIAVFWLVGASGQLTASVTMGLVLLVSCAGLATLPHTRANRTLMKLPS